MKKVVIKAYRPRLRMALTAAGAAALAIGAYGLYSYTRATTVVDFERAQTERDRLLKRAKRLPAAEAGALREQARALTLPDGAPLPPYVDFDAVFIPDTHQAAGLIAPHLAFHEVRGVTLLGPSAWNHPGLLELGGRHVEGAVFPGAYSASIHAPSLSP